MIVAGEPNYSTERTSEIWAIVEISTGRFYKCRSGKCAWATSGDARKAFKLCAEIDIQSQTDFSLFYIEAPLMWTEREDQQSNP